MSRDVARMISEIKVKANALNRQAAHYATMSKRKAEQANAVLGAIELLEGVTDDVDDFAVESEGSGGNEIRRITSRSYAAADKLGGFLKDKEDQSAKCSVILKDLGMTYVTQERMTLAFPEAFELREVDGTKVVTLKNADALGQRVSVDANGFPDDGSGGDTGGNGF